MQTIRKYFVVCLLAVCSLKMQAQYCTNATDTVYGLTATGRIVPINVNTAAAQPSPNRDSTGTGVNANGLGFSALNGSFYFFNRCNTLGVVDLIQFVRYIPSTRTTTILADPPATFTATTKSRSGCMNTAGDGYYAINPGAAAGPTLYYFSVGTGTWTTITTSFKSKTGVNVANIVSLNSGDMAFDGSGNLWMISSGSGDYALYKIKAPLPVIPTASVVVDTIISERATPTGDNFTGVAFNAAGKLYLSTGAGTNPGNNKLYELATTTGVLTLKGSLLAGYGDDLTSCSYPPGVLPVVWVNFAAAFQTNAVQLGWTVNEKEMVSGYTIEFSTDAEHWQTIGHIEKDNTNSGGLKTYRYIHHEFNENGNYYRIVQVSATGEKTNSSIRFVNTKDDRQIYIGPNPTKDIMYIYNRRNDCKYLAQVCDKDGRLVYSIVMAPGQPSISIGHLPKGMYVLKLSSSAINERPGSYRFIKW
jgi:hypothetical protein